ncbi:serine/threonine-protein kinase [Paucibacter sp. Y2R2-4]|uniref:serine/threonine-protein kinase n=1 Tax=Paucibacter sp. Y2R2-4 TaxID=2893553 RepID=UPI0021E3A93D|nr:serine/threonine-protein kinase [Paucibacter sp. Y2R2-4]MCV2350907.1 serine/threonine protein kinase [Paucibacter sp. Y2R2-4]
MKHLPCAAEHWPEFSALLDQALDLPTPERSAWLQALPAEARHLRSALTRVLSQDQTQAPLLDAPRLSVAQEPWGDEAVAFSAGQVLGPWQLRQRLGRGGMGEVWLAERGDGAYQRQVALKLPHALALAGQGRQRFSRERDILAALQHPHIAQFFDAGTAELGEGALQPWLALEYVPGRNLVDDCRERGLSVLERLRLMLQVMEAVQYAHGQLLVHRDLKPSNVMVTPQGQVKLLDFGIAKLLLPDAEMGAALGEVEPTRLLLATPAYAAPEQWTGGPVSVATDVYALGALMHTVLCGQPPPPWRAGQEPALPSQTVTAPHAEQCGLSLARLQRSLRGDLDALMSMALASEPNQRYGSVQALSEDVRRYLAGLPLRARRLSWAAGLRKQLRRHYLLVSVSAAVLLSLTLGLVATLWQAQQAAQQARRAEAIQHYLLDLFRTLDPRQSDAQDPALGMRRLLQQQMAQIEQHLPRDPETADELLRLSATLAVYLSDEPRSLDLARLRWRVLQERLGAKHSRSGEAGLSLIWALRAAGRQAEADQVLQVLDAQLPAQGLPRAEWLLARHDQLQAAGASWPQRLAAVQQALQRYETDAPLDSGHVAALQHLAALQLEAQQWAAAQSTLSRALALVTRAQPAIALDHARLLGLRAQLWAALQQPQAQANDLAQAVQLLRGSLGLHNPLAWPLLAQQQALGCAANAPPEAAALTRTLWQELQPLLAARAASHVEGQRDVRAQRLRDQAALCALLNR